VDKNITWSVDNASLITVSDGSINRSGNDENVTLTATIGSETKPFDLRILKSVTSTEDRFAQDMEWLTFSKILDKNRNNHNVVYNLVKPLPSITPNNSFISWTSTNEDVIATTGDVFRDGLEHKYVTLTATITDGTDSIKKEFFMKVLKNALEDKKDTTFNRVDENSTNISIVFDEGDESNVSTTLDFDTTIASKVEKIINDDSVKTVLELDNSVLEVYLNTDGTTQTQTETIDENNNSVISSIVADVTQSKTSIDVNGTVKTSKNKLEAGIDSKGYVSHVVTNAKTSKATSKIAGSQVEFEDGQLTTTYTANSTVNGEDVILEAIAVTQDDGKTMTRFRIRNLTTGVVRDIENTTEASTPFEVGNSVDIDKIDGTLYIKTQAPLGDEALIIE
jgi:hypothetical protein